MAPASGKRLQHRISIDPSMGPIYDWLRDLDSATRAREVVYLVRLGALVHMGSKGVHLSVAHDEHLANPQPPSMKDWDFDNVCVPPPRR